MKQITFVSFTLSLFLIAVFGCMRRNGNNGNKKSPEQAPPEPAPPQPCCRRSKYEIKTSEFLSTNVLQPKIIDVGRCEGPCHLNGHSLLESNSTNISRYTLLMERYKKAFPERVQAQTRVPYCSPSKYRAVDVILQKAEGEIAKITIEDMVVDKCICV